MQNPSAYSVKSAWDWDWNISANELVTEPYTRLRSSCTIRRVFFHLLKILKNQNYIFLLRGTTWQTTLNLGPMFCTINVLWYICIYKLIRTEFFLSLSFCFFQRNVFFICILRTFITNFHFIFLLTSITLPTLQLTISTVYLILCSYRVFVN